MSKPLRVLIVEDSEADALLLLEELRRGGYEPMYKRVDIAEALSAIMADPARAMETLTHLNQMGVGLSIDNFGTGYSSLAYLKRLPVQEIKIDKSFVIDMLVNEDEAVIVISIISLAHNLGLKVVAEGVENQETRERLSAFGCDSAQGYLMSRPLPAAEFSRWMSESAGGAQGEGRSS